MNNTIYDISTNHLNGTIDGNITRLNFLGDELHFNGSGYINITSNNTLKPANYISISAWVKMDSSPVDIGGIIAHTHDNADDESGFYLNYHTASNKLDFSLKTTSSTIAASRVGITPDIDKWMFVTAVYDGSKNKLYKNGILKSEVSLSGAIDWTFSPPFMTIGRFADSDESNPFKGSLSDVAVWNRALSQTEIKQLMQTSPNTKDTSLIGYWPLNEGFAATVYDNSLNVNHGSISSTVWSKSAPEIFGNKLYSMQGSSVQAKIIAQDTNQPPLFILETVSPDISFENNTLKYASIIDGNYNATINDTRNNIKTNFEIINYNNPNINILSLALSNINLNEHNITSIQYIGKNGNTENFIVSGSQNLGNNSNLQVPVYNNNKDFSLKLNIDNNTSAWWYNFDDHKLYQDNYGSNAFVSTIDNGNHSFNINGTFNYAYIPEQIDHIELKIPLGTYEGASASNLNNISLFQFEKDKDIVKIGQILPLDTIAYEDKVEINQQGIVQKSSKEKNNLDVNLSTNIISLKDTDNTIQSEVKYIAEVDNTTLTSIYSNSNINVTFSSQDKGYKIYQKQKKDVCEIRDISQESNIVFDDFKNKHTFAYNKGGISFAHSKYNNTQALMISDASNDLVEYNTSNGVNTYAGTYEVLSTQNLSCKNNMDDSIVQINDILKLNLSVDGYDNLSFGHKDGKIYTLNYTKADETTKVYFLDSNATKTLASYKGYPTSLKKQKTIPSDTWTYLNLSLSSILCSSVGVSPSCDQINTLSSVFSDNFTIYKYNQGWSYWDANSSVDHNANKFTSIDPREGILIKKKVSTSVTLDIPYNIFHKIYTRSFQPYTTGWFLVNNNFDKSLTQVKSTLETNHKKLQYILQLNASDWNVYAPTNNGAVTSTIPRISTIDDDSSFWIYMTE